MKKNIFIIFITMSGLVFSQENIDEDFLMSLPSEIRNDFIKEMGENAQVEDQVFNPPNTAIRTLGANLQQIKIDLRNIEEELASKKGTDTKEITRFGTNFFNTFQSTFSPINEPNVSPDYVVDFGDTINIQLIGSSTETLSEVVRADGAVLVPDVGRIVVAGLPLARVDDLIRSKVSERLLGTDAFTTLAHIREINVLVVGSVNNPGIYRLNGASNPLSVLNAAGGISDGGSFRNISHKRAGKVLRTIDLYEILIKGDLAFGFSLRSGDSIVVNPKGKEVSISGGIANPAIYELLEKEGLQEALNYAGNLLQGASNEIKIERSGDKGSKQKYKVTLPSSRNFALQNGDDIKVNNYTPISNPIHTVELTGEVNNPGIYTVEEGSTLSSLIKQAGGYKNGAYEYGGVLIRESAKRVEKMINERIYNDMIKFIATSADAKEIVSGGSGTLPLILSEFKNAEPVGRVTAEFDLDRLATNKSLDTLLHDNDKIHIPTFSQEIFVLGEVLTPGARLYQNDLSASDYIEQSGGLGLYGDKERIVVISPNGDSYLWTGGVFALSRSKFDLIPGSVIYVPREIGKLSGLNYAATIAPIFSSLAISLASLNSIND